MRIENCYDPYVDVPLDKSWDSLFLRFLICKEGEK
jgi:hypothetical protein